MTHEQLFSLIGYSRSYIAKIETGARRYDQHLLKATANALECELADLLVGRPGRGVCELEGSPKRSRQGHEAQYG